MLPRTNGGRPAARLLETVLGTALLLCPASRAAAQSFDSVVVFDWVSPNRTGDTGSPIDIATRFDRGYAVWQKYEGGAGDTIMFSQSSDLSTWSPPWYLCLTGETSNHDRNPAIVASPEDGTAGPDTIHVALSYNDAIGMMRNTIGGDPSGWQSCPWSLGFVDYGDQPDLAVSRRPAAGQDYRLYVAYRYYYYSAPAIRLRRSLDSGATYEGDSVGAPVSYVLSSGIATDGADLSALECGHPRIAAGDGDDIHAVFDCFNASHTSTRAYYRRSTDGGVTWNAPVALGQGPPSAHPAIGVCGERVFLVWEEGAGTIQLGRSLDRGATLQAPVPVWLSGTGNTTPDLAVADGEVYVTWSTSAWEAVYRRSTDGGASFADPAITLGSSSWFPTFPRIARAAEHVATAFISGTFKLGTRRSDTNVGLTCDCLGPPVPGLDVAIDADGSTSRVTWSPVPGVSAFNSYAGVIGAAGLPLTPGGPYTHVCLEAADAGGDGVTLSTDAALPTPGEARYYLAAARGACGQGTLGASSAGAPRPDPAPCP